MLRDQHGSAVPAQNVKSKVTDFASETELVGNGRWHLPPRRRNVGPEQIANAKAEIATAAEATKQFNLSRECQLDATELVRRAEYALGKAIRKGQAEGTIRRRGQGGGQPSWTDTPRSDITLSSPNDFATHGELVGQAGKDNGIYALSEAAEDDMDAALDEAKAEGNLSRANVVRKVKKQACDRAPGRADNAWYGERGY